MDGTLESQHVAKQGPCGDVDTDRADHNGCDDEQLHSQPDPFQERQLDVVPKVFHLVHHLIRHVVSQASLGCLAEDLLEGL